MRIIGRVLTALGGLAMLAPPAWAHSSTRVHTHGQELVSVLILAVALGAGLLLRQFGSAPSKRG